MAGLLSYYRSIPFQLAAVSLSILISSASTSLTLNNSALNFLEDPKLVLGDVCTTVSNASRVSSLILLEGFNFSIFE